MEVWTTVYLVALTYRSRAGCSVCLAEYGVPCSPLCCVYPDLAEICVFLGIPMSPSVSTGHRDVPPKMVAGTSVAQDKKCAIVWKSRSAAELCEEVVSTYIQNCQLFVYSEVVSTYIQNCLSTREPYGYTYHSQKLLYSPPSSPPNLPPPPPATTATKSTSLVTKVKHIPGLSCWKLTMS